MGTLKQAAIEVLPALNVDPAASQLDALEEFLARAVRDGRSGVYSVQAHRFALVFVGQHGGDPDAVWPSAFAAAAILIPLKAQSVFDHIAVCWANGAGEGFAAAAELLRHEGVLSQGQQLAQSWTDPANWRDPRLSPTLSPAAGLEHALDGVADVLSEDSKHQDDAWSTRLKRAMRLVDVALQSRGGEAIGVSVAGFEPPAPEQRGAWFVGYRASVEDEWRRIDGTALAKAQPRTGTATGPLVGRNIFLSYARSDGPNFAWPIYGLLREAGATVWFDQIERVDQGALNEGFLTVVEQCDTFVACATDEFFERAGYGVQELAWAIEAKARGAALHNVVVTGDESLLPEAVRGWTIIRRRDLGSISRRLEQAQASTETSAAVVSIDLPVSGPVSLPDLPDTAQWLLRRDHAVRYGRLTGEAFERALNDDETETGRRARLALVQAHEGLQWDGRLSGWQTWPDDSCVRDLRWRIASMRLLFDLYRPLSFSGEAEEILAEDMDVFTATQTPALQWRDTDGWDDVERRFALRHDLGALRQFATLLERGLFAGAVTVEDERLEAWQRDIEGRRRLTLDAILGMRLAGRWSWRADPPNWDVLYSSWERFFGGQNQSERLRDLGPETVQRLGAARPVIAPALASLIWRSLRSQRSEVAEVKTVAQAGGFSFQLAVGPEAPVAPSAVAVKDIFCGVHLIDPQNVSLTVVRHGVAEKVVGLRARDHYPAENGN